MMKGGIVVLLIGCIMNCSFTKAQSYEVKSFDEFEQFLSSTTDTFYVINFWATWCKPCIEEMPYFERLNQERKNVKVILVSMDGESYWAKSVRPFIEKNNIQSDVWVIQDKKPIDWIDRIDPKWQGSIPATLFLNRTRGIKQFEEHEFTYDQLTETIHSISQVYTE